MLNAARRALRYHELGSWSNCTSFVLSVGWARLYGHSASSAQLASAQAMHEHRL